MHELSQGQICIFLKACFDRLSDLVYVFEVGVSRAAVTSMNRVLLYVGFSSRLRRELMGQFTTECFW